MKAYEWVSRYGRREFEIPDGPKNESEEEWSRRVGIAEVEAIGDDCVGKLRIFLNGLNGTSAYPSHYFQVSNFGMCHADFWVATEHYEEALLYALDIVERLQRIQTMVDDRDRLNRDFHLRHGHALHNPCRDCDPEEVSIREHARRQRQDPT